MTIEDSGLHYQRLLQVLGRAVKDYGAKNVLNHIKSMQENDDSPEGFKNRVLDLICKKYQIKSGEIFSKSRRGEIPAARKVAIIVFYRNYSFNLDKISKSLCVSKQYCGSVVSEFLTMTENNPYHKKFLEIVHSVETEIKQKNIKKVSHE